MDNFILYLIIIDSYGAHSIERYLNRPENYKQTSWHVSIVKTSLLQVNSMQTFVKAGRPRLAVSLTNFHVEIVCTSDITGNAQSNIY